MKKTVTFISLIMLAIIWLASGSAYAQEKIDKEPSTDSKAEQSKKVKASKDVTFYEVARLIMTKEEKEIYKHLPDKNAQLNFIEEFWEKRDPTPETEENESRDEFYTRVAFANKYFKEYTKDRGWDTERGRILLQLGFPDKRELGDYAPTSRGQLMTSKRSHVEMWIYYRYNLVLYFQGDDDAASRMRLTRVPSQLGFALDRVKYNMNLVSKADLKNSFKFDVKYDKDQFEISIPVKKVSFAESTDDRMMVDLDIKVYIYRDNKKVDVVTMPKTVSMEKDKLLDLKTIEFSIPYTLTEKGHYLFDVVIEEKSTSEKFRDTTKYKI